MIRSRLAMLGLAALLPSVGFAQGPVVQLRGTVRDSVGSPLAGAEVVVGRRSAVTTAQGAFVVDSLMPGRHSLTVRKIGFTPIRQILEVPPGGLQGLEYSMSESATVLPTLVVEGERPGIYGTIALVAERPAAGARVILSGPGGGEVTTDSAGRFAFPGLRRGDYLVRVTLAGFTERRVAVTIERNEGRELAINLLPTNRIASRGDVGALDDLSKRLSLGMRSDRLMGGDLARRGPINVCDLPQLRSVVGGPNNPITLILNGTTVYRNMPVHSLCSWRADEIEMVEFAPTVCSEVTLTVAKLLGTRCDRFSRRLGAPPRSLSGQTGLMSGADPGPFVVLWERK